MRGAAGGDVEQPANGRRGLASPRRRATNLIRGYDGLRDKLGRSRVVQSVSLGLTSYQRGNAVGAIEVVGKPSNSSYRALLIRRPLSVMLWSVLLLDTRRAAEYSNYQHVVSGDILQHGQHTDCPGGRKVTEANAQDSQHEAANSLFGGLDLPKKQIVMTIDDYRSLDSDAVRHAFVDDMNLIWLSEVDGLFGTNRLPWQCQKVAERLFDHADEVGEPVRILKGTRTSEFYGDWFVDRVRTLVEKGVSVEVVLAEPPSEDERRLWTHLVPKRRAFPNFALFHLPEFDPYLHHYFIVGNRAYRLEFPHKRWAGPANDFQPERPARFSSFDSEVGCLILRFRQIIMSIAIPF